MDTERARIENELLDLFATTTQISRDKLARDVLLADVGVDSLSTVELIFAIEEKYNISIPFNANDRAGADSRAFSTVGNVLDAVTELILAKAPAGAEQPVPVLANAAAGAEHSAPIAE
jgi:acyl carrier protein